MSTPFKRTTTFMACLCDRRFVWQGHLKLLFLRLHFVASKSGVGCRRYKPKPKTLPLNQNHNNRTGYLHI